MTVMPDMMEGEILFFPFTLKESISECCTGTYRFTWYCGTCMWGLMLGSNVRTSNIPTQFILSLFLSVTSILVGTCRKKQLIEYGSAWISLVYSACIGVAPLNWSCCAFCQQRDQSRGSNSNAGNMDQTWANFRLSYYVSDFGQMISVWIMVSINAPFYNSLK